MFTNTHIELKCTSVSVPCILQKNTISSFFHQSQLSRLTTILLLALLECLVESVTQGNIRLVRGAVQELLQLHGTRVVWVLLVLGRLGGLLGEGSLTSTSTATPHHSRSKGVAHCRTNRNSRSCCGHLGHQPWLSRLSLDRCWWGRWWGACHWNARSRGGLGDLENPPDRPLRGILMCFTIPRSNKL